jgi:hypothetical protein
MDADDLTLVADGYAAGDKFYVHTGASWQGYTYDGTTYGGLVLNAGETFLVKIDAAHAQVDWDYVVGGAPVAATSDIKKVVKSNSVLR